MFVCVGLADPLPALMTLLVINALCFMPTLALVNSLSFRNIDDPNRFSRIAVGGTIGWIVFGLGGGFSAGRIGEARVLLSCRRRGGGDGALLPHAAAHAAEGRQAAATCSAWGALKLLEGAVVPGLCGLCAFLISIPLSFYFTWGNAFLVETGEPVAHGAQTLCQCSEIVVMLVMPWFIARIGLK